ncbi:uncharacterized protein RHOBADRAFT_53914 [Rhodotorula graminis WP1]|uniref:histone deacetylase n=1 Tax=Rhodotorula graminis (strain WP1) TaxID=578459 RepID=A0A194S3A3_RHOGW|nr:uncharacterized protein RHOBADRAFT_53914 [Rhodotorula graminis WP1]KPV75004.1 hypothetical protein RHOBADRAFT_53914 [Rhodotorula graminis WP1]
MQRRVSYVHSDALTQAADRLPSNLGRATLVDRLISSLDLIIIDPDTAAPAERGRARTVPPQPATRADLVRFHDPRYIDAILGTHDDDSSSSSSSSDASSSSSPPPQPTFGLASDSIERPNKRRKTDTDTLGLQDDCPVFAGLPDYARLVAGASMTAARELRDGRADIAINWTGGRHHGKRGEAAGFCYVNDIVLAIMELRSAPQRALPPSSSPSPSPPSSPRPLDDAPSASSPPPSAPATYPSRISRVLYLDLDLHHGDGVESAFLASPYVLTLSTHLHAPLFYPATGALESTGPPGEPRAKGAYHALNVPLEPGAGEDTLRRVWASCVERVKEAFQPDAVVLQLGTDGLAGDPCKEWNLSLSALGFAVERVLSWNKRTLLLGGGGYHSPNAARAWAYLTSVALGRPLPLDTPIPPDLPSSTYELFGPDWTLDVPEAYGVRDRNGDESLGRVESAFEGSGVELP